MSEPTPQAEWCGDRGPRIGNEGAMVCVLPAGHEGQHEGDPSWRQHGWPNDRPVFRHPDLPCPQPDTAPRTCIDPRCDCRKPGSPLVGAPAEPEFEPTSQEVC